MCGRGTCGSNCLVIPDVHRLAYRHSRSGDRVGPGLQHTPGGRGGGVGEAWGLTWKGRSTVPLPIWFTLGRDPP